MDIVHKFGPIQALSLIPQLSLSSFLYKSNLNLRNTRIIACQRYCVVLQGESFIFVLPVLFSFFSFPIEQNSFQQRCMIWRQLSLKLRLFHLVPSNPDLRDSSITDDFPLKMGVLFHRLFSYFKTTLTTNKKKSSLKSYIS